MTTTKSPRLASQRGIEDYSAIIPVLSKPVLFGFEIHNEIHNLFNIVNDI